MSLSRGPRQTSLCFIVTPYASRLTLYGSNSLLMRDGAALGGKMCVEPPWERVEPSKGWVGATSRPQANGLLCRGKLWLEERTPEQLKGEGG